MQSVHGVRARVMRTGARRSLQECACVPVRAQGPQAAGLAGLAIAMCCARRASGPPGAPQRTARSESWFRIGRRTHRRETHRGKEAVDARTSSARGLSQRLGHVSGTEREWASAAARACDVA